jgi:RNA polymerase sigma-70 factor (ECF subfamily)
MIDDNDKVIEGLKSGDKAVFEAIYREYYTQLCLYSVKYVESIEDSEEIVQDLFAKLWDMHKELEINSSLNAYLYRAVQNYSLNFLRKKKTKDKYIVVNADAPNSAFTTGLVKMEEDELRIILKHAILKLPEKRREIFELSRFDGFNNDKIATKLSISIKTVENQMTKALKYLRIILKDYAPLAFFYYLINSVL